jgi:hypothetical protein
LVFLEPVPVTGAYHPNSKDVILRDEVLM